MKNQAFQEITSIILTVILSSAAIVGITYALRGYINQSEEPEEVVKNFYQSWVNQKDSPIASRFYENHKDLTKNLEDDLADTIASFDKGGADPILCAQDKPQDMEYELIRQTDANAIVEIKQYFGGNSQTIKVGLMKQDDQWLIDEIICSDEISGEAGTKETNKVGDFIRDNISELSPKEAVLGGTFYVTEITFPAPGIALVSYEDGHIALEAQAEYKINKNNEVVVERFKLLKD